MKYEILDLNTGPFETSANLRRLSAESDEVSALEATRRNRAATRQAIIVAIRKSGFTFRTRSDWKAKDIKVKADDWDYTSIVIHHAGNSYSCEMDEVKALKRAEATDMASFGHLSYHYAISCTGTIFEALDIRKKGAHLKDGNSGRIGVVLLADLSDPGEAYEEEYRYKPIRDRLNRIGDLTGDFVDIRHDGMHAKQISALTQLVHTLKSYFPITQLGGHREAQWIASNEGRACPGRIGMEMVQTLRAQLGLERPR